MGKSPLDQRCPRAHGSKDDKRRAEVIPLSVLLPGGTGVLQAEPTTEFATNHNCISLTCKNSGIQTNSSEKLLSFDGSVLQFQLSVCSVVHILLALEKSN